jgi:acetoacetate decarboxylase
VGITGQLGRDRFGYSMPVDAPLYEPFPLYYEDARILLFPYLTDAAKAAALVPPPLEVVTVDPQGTLALGEVVFAKYPFSNIGAYNEVAQTIAVTYKGTPGAYAVRLHVTNDQALAAGREIGGFPKKLGVIRFDEGEVYTSTLEAPAGQLICSAELAPMQPVPWLAELPITYYSLRVIPNPADPKTPSLAQLVQSTWVLDHGTFWSARGMASFTGVSAQNPYHSLPIVRLLPSMNPAAATEQERKTPGMGLFRGNMHVGQVAIVETY